MVAISARHLTTCYARRTYGLQGAFRCRSSSSIAAAPRPVFAPVIDGETVKPFYVTTPIFYVNASPHIGHLHSLLLTDVLARYSRLRNPQVPVRFCTGTDEHGLKIQQAAAAAGLAPKEFCDGISQRFRDLAELANISHTTFIRTSEERHYRAVKNFWTTLADAGHIYKGSHAGWYAVSDECFYTETQVGEVDGKMVALESGSVVEWTEEENYKFRLSAFQDRMIEWLESSPEAVHPPSHHAALLSTLRAGPLQDLSVSRPRSRVQWGVPVPGDEEQQTIYVWVDALINYITVAGYPWQENDQGLAQGWPADVSIVGKDIIRFHTLHWPALLMAHNLPPPRRVLAHAHWTMHKSKMSKSRGNVADPIQAMAKWGVDPVRWYLMRQGGSLAVDADYSEAQLETSYRQLSSQIGNLLSRIASPKLLERVGGLDSTSVHEEDAAVESMLSGAREAFEGRMEKFEIQRALEGVMDLVMESNKHFTALQPWTASAAPEVVARAIAYSYHSLRIAGILCQPVMPSKAAEMLDRLGVASDQRGWDHAAWTGAEVVKTVTGGEGHLFPPVESETSDVAKRPASPRPRKEKKQKKDKTSDVT